MTWMPENPERRQHDRKHVRIEAAFQFGDAPARVALVRNISLGGAWIETGENVPSIGDEGRMHARVCIQPDKHVHLYMMARVVRRTDHGIGVSFVDMGMESYENLSALIRELEKEDKSDPVNA